MITEWRFNSTNYKNRIVCDDGTVYNHLGKKLRVKPSKKGGYLRIRICENGYETYRWLHRMVAFCFLGDCLGLEVHHIDRNITNNHYSNLQIVTKQENLNLRQF